MFSIWFYSTALAESVFDTATGMSEISVTKVSSAALRELSARLWKDHLRHPDQGSF